MALRVNDPAPDFAAADQDGNTVTLSDLAGRYSILYFYPKDNTPICTLEACTFRDDLGDFERLNVPVYGVSADTVYSHRQFANQHGIRFRLLADPARRMIDAYDVRGFLGRTSRTTYILDPAGRIAGVHRAEFSGRGHAAWAKHALGALGVHLAPVPASP